MDINVAAEGHVGLEAADVEADIRAVAGYDKDVRRAFEAIGAPPPRGRAPGFEALLRIMVGQQVSVAAAASIFKRIEDASAGDVSAEAMRALDDEALRGLGLSRQKIAYTRCLSDAVTSGALDIEGLAALDDDAASAAITAIKGFGKWSADIYLLFCLGRRDMWPGGDLAVRAALGLLKGHQERPDERATHEMVEHWRPARGSMAVFLWHYYAAVGKSGQPI
ncbi:MAG: DNA-3-methyladenine glycosylase 2 family protein [Pseudomonadota bacterium]